MTNNRLIAVIAGHRGQGTGAVGIIDEAVENVEMRNLICEELAQHGIPFVTDSIKDTLNEIVTTLRAMLKKYDIAIDIHFNSCGDPSVGGTEVIIPNRYTSDEWQIADELLTTTCAILGTKNRGVKTEQQTPHQRLAMLSNYDACNILIEICFVNNKNDIKAYKAHKGELAKAYAEILTKWAKK
jgi:N-acetylmuramoyl-L-alanine amidase